MRKSTVERDRIQTTILRIRIAYCIRKSTNTFTIRNTYCIVTATKVARKRLNVTLYFIHHTLCKTTTWRQCVNFVSFIVKVVKNKQLERVSKMCTDWQDVYEKFYVVESLQPSEHPLWQLPFSVTGYEEHLLDHNIPTTLYKIWTVLCDPTIKT